MKPSCYRSDITTTMCIKSLQRATEMVVTARIITVGSMVYGKWLASFGAGTKLTYIGSG